MATGPGGSARPTHCGPARSRHSEPSGKAGEIAGEIERRLVSGRYMFGEPLSTLELAREFRASRQPIAAAIGHLRSCGYVEVVPKTGCKIVSPSAAEICDFFIVLCKVEAIGAAFAAQRYEGDEADQLIEAARDPDRGGAQWNRGIFTGHRGLAFVWEMARSRALAEQVAGMRRLAAFYMRQDPEIPNPDPRIATSAGWDAIALAIKVRDVAGAGHLMERHIFRMLSTASPG